MLATFIVSLGSLSGVIAAPLNRNPYFSYMLMYLISLAVSTLIGDAILHLLPHVSITIILKIFKYIV